MVLSRVLAERALLRLCLDIVQGCGIRVIRITLCLLSGCVLFAAPLVLFFIFSACRSSPSSFLLKYVCTLLLHSDYCGKVTLASVQTYLHIVFHRNKVSGTLRVCIHFRQQITRTYALIRNVLILQNTNCTSVFSSFKSWVVHLCL